MEIQTLENIYPESSHFISKDTEVLGKLRYMTKVPHLSLGHASSSTSLFPLHQAAFCVFSSLSSCIQERDYSHTSEMNHVTQFKQPPFFFFFCFLGPHPQHTEGRRLGVESELWLPAYATVTAMPDPSCICDLHHISRPGIKPATSWFLVIFISSAP